jgi:hypothetical protein
MAITINGGGTITGISAGGLPDGSVTAADIESSLDLSAKTVTLPAGVGGKVLQVLSATKTDPFSTTSTSYVDVTGLSVTITPSSTSSKILIMGHANGNGTANISQVYLQLVRDSTPVGGGTTSGSRPSCITRFYYNDANVTATGSWTYLDSPSTTSAVTYKIQAKTQGSGTVYLGSTQNDSNSADGARQSQSITVVEIGA